MPISAPGHALEKMWHASSLCGRYLVAAASTICSQSSQPCSSMRSLALWVQPTNMSWIHVSSVTRLARSLVLSHFKESLVMPIVRKMSAAVDPGGDRCPAGALSTASDNGFSSFLRRAVASS